MYAGQRNDEVTQRCDVYQAAPAHLAQTEMHHFKEDIRKLI